MGRLVDATRFISLSKPYPSYNPQAYTHEVEIYHTQEPVGRKELPTLIAVLRKLLETHNKLDVLAGGFNLILRAWMRNVLGPKPAGDPSARKACIQQWLTKCRCQWCSQVQSFLLQDSETAVWILLQKVGMHNRVHVEGYLREFVTVEGATWMDTKTKPQGLKVCR